MVNKGVFHRSLLVSRLRKAQGKVSGAAICEELGISRVAVWKHIEALKACGYGIDSDHGGYQLVRDGDFLYPWEFPDMEDRIVHFGQTDSTMERGLELALSGGGRERVVIAESQRKGRGRRGNSWKSDQGGLFCTLLLYPVLRIKDFFRPVIAAGIALCRTVRELSGEEAWLEWPNDLYVGGKKVAGILPEFFSSGESLRFFNLGIGVNVENRVQDPAGASLHALTGKRCMRREVLRTFLEKFQEFQNDGFLDSGLSGEWWDLSASDAKPVIGNDGERLGYVHGIDEAGELLVDTGRGGVKTFGFGMASIIDKGKKP